MRYRFIILTTLLFTFYSSVFAQEEKYISLFVYNFTKYFDWPEDMKSGNFVIQVIGHQSVYDELVKITQGKKVGTQDVIVQHLKSVDELKNGHIIFLGHWQSRFIEDVKTKVGSYPTLLITEMEGLLNEGSAINFVIRDGSIKFELNTTNVDKQQIKTDPRIRELAYRVVD